MRGFTPLARLFDVAKYGKCRKGRKMSDCALLSPREMAEKSGWPERRIRSLIASKQIKHLKIGSTFYLPEDAIADFVRRNMLEPEQGGSADVPGQD